MSIFTKDCPQCAETNAAYAVRCKCGFAFSADDGADSQTEEEIAAEEEKLYQEYLAARARQAGGQANDGGTSAASQPADAAEPKEAEETKPDVDSTQTKPKVQTAHVVESGTERKPAKVEPPAAPAVAQTAKVESAPPTPKPPVAIPPVQATVPGGATESKPARVAAPAAPAVTQTTNPSPTPPAQTTVPAGTTETQVSKPSAKAKQSWLISGAESDAPTQPPAAKPTPPPTARPAANAKPTPTATKPDAAKMSAAERAKKLEQRLREVQTKRDTKATAMRATSTGKTNKNAEAAKPNPAPVSVAPARTPAPSAAPQPTAAPTAAKTDDTSAPLPSKPISAAHHTQPDQPQTVDNRTPPEAKQVNGTDTVPPASDTIEVPAAKEAVATPGNPATAKADLEAALQALNTKTPASTESGNHAGQADAGGQELVDTDAQTMLGDLTEKSGLGCTEKECPNCTALVPMDAERCACGFAFPPEDDAMPSLSLTDSDVEALEKRKKSSGISHLG